MRTLLSLAFLFAAFNLIAADIVTNLIVYAADLTYEPLANRYITLTPTDENESFGYVISREPRKQKADSDGLTTFTNVVNGFYTLSLASTPPSTFYLAITNGSARDVNVTNYLAAASQSNNGIGNSYSKVQSDSRYIGGVAAGSNITLTTNGTPALITVSSTGGGADHTGEIDGEGTGSLTNFLSIDADTLTVDTFSASTYSVVTLDVSGNTTLGDGLGDTLDVSGPATFDSTVAILGNMTFGDTSGDTITVNATPTFLAAIDVQSTIGDSSDGTVDVTGDMDVESTLYAGLFNGDGSALTDVMAVQVHVPVRNDTASIIAKGTPVYISGYNSGTDELQVTPADADSSSTMPAIGLAEEQIAVGGSGDVVMSGLIDGLNTSAYSVGDSVYISSTAGTLTGTRPTGASVLVQKVGTVVRSHVTLGAIQVTGANRANDIPNSMDINGTLDVTGATTLDSTLAVTGVGTLTAGLDVRGNIYDGADTEVVIQDDLTLNGTLTTTYEVQLQGDVYLGGGTGQTIGLGADGDDILDFNTVKGFPCEIAMTCSAEDSQPDASAIAFSFRMPYSMTVSEVYMSINDTIPSGSMIITAIDVEDTENVLASAFTWDNADGVSVSLTGASLDATSLPKDDKIEIEIGAITAPSGGTGLKIWLIGTKY